MDLDAIRIFFCSEDRRSQVMIPWNYLKDLKLVVFHPDSRKTGLETGFETGLHRKTAFSIERPFCVGKASAEIALLGSIVASKDRWN